MVSTGTMNLHIQVGKGTYVVKNIDVDTLLSGTMDQSPRDDVLRQYPVYVMTETLRRYVWMVLYTLRRYVWMM